MSIGCTFDTSEETQGRSRLCTAPSSGLPELQLTGYPVDCPPLCERHAAFVAGYVQGQYDAQGRPEDFDPGNLIHSCLNLMECTIIGTGHGDQRVMKTSITGGFDPYEVYHLECGCVVI